MNADRLLLGSLFSASTLGLYSIAYNLATIPDGLANRLFGTIAFPALSEAVRCHSGRVPEIFWRMRRLTDTALLIFSGVLASAGPEIVRLLYDERYSAAGWILQYLSIGLLFSRYAITQNAYLALGRPDYVASLSVIKLTSLVTIVPLLFAVMGLRGAVLGISLHMLPCAVWTYFLGRTYGLSNLRFELLMLGGWPIGWLIGALFTLGMHVLRATV